VVSSANTIAFNVTTASTAAAVTITVTNVVNSASASSAAAFYVERLTTATGVDLELGTGGSSLAVLSGVGSTSATCSPKGFGSATSQATITFTPTTTVPATSGTITITATSTFTFTSSVATDYTLSCNGASIPIATAAQSAGTSLVVTLGNTPSGTSACTLTVTKLNMAFSMTNPVTAASVTIATSADAGTVFWASAAVSCYAAQATAPTVSGQLFTAPSKSNTLAFVATFSTNLATTNSVRLTLPSGFTFASPAVTGNNGAVFGGVVSSANTIAFNVTAASTAAAVTITVFSVVNPASVASAAAFYVERLTTATGVSAEVGSSSASAISATTSSPSASSASSLSTLLCLSIPTASVLILL